MPDIDAYDNHILHIHHPLGARGLYIGNNATLTKYKDDEFILPRKSLLNLSTTPHTYKSTYNGKERKFHVWVAHVLSEYS